jgi:hypothetical protein
LDAPALLTASTRSVTLGSIFQFYLEENKQLTFLAAKNQCSKLNVQSCWLIFFALIVQWRISATFSKLKHDNPTKEGLIFD